MGQAVVEVSMAVELGRRIGREWRGRAPTGRQQQNHVFGEHCVTASDRGQFRDHKYVPSSFLTAM